jgi:tetratricopeptide (TPR) repeat protein
MLIDRDRVVGHRLAAEWLERAGGGDPLVLAQSAHHAERAAEDLVQLGDGEGAASAFARAANCHTAARHFEAAVAASLRALELADPERHEAAELMGWLDALSTSVNSVRSAPRLSDLADRLLPRIDAAGTAPQRVAARVALGRAFGSTDSFARAYELLDHARVVSDGCQELRRDVLRADVIVSGLHGDYTRRLHALEELEALGALEDFRGLLGRASHLSNAGDLQGALDALARAEASCSPNDPVAAVLWHKQLGLAYLNAREFAKAAPACAKAAELARAVGLRYDVGSSLHNLGDARLRLGELGAARAAFSESLEVAERYGYERLTRLDRVYLAYLDGLEGEPGARAYLEAHIVGAEASGYLNEVIEGEWLLASLLKHRGERAEARSRFERLSALAKRFGNGFIEQEAIEALADL